MCGNILTARCIYIFYINVQSVLISHENNGTYVHVDGRLTLAHPWSYNKKHRIRISISKKHSNICTNDYSIKMKFTQVYSWPVVYSASARTEQHCNSIWPAVRFHFRVSEKSMEEKYYSHRHTHAQSLLSRGVQKGGVEVLAEGEGGKNTDNTNC